MRQVRHKQCSVQNTSLGHSSMTTTAAIASTDIWLLLRDDVFVDFFNTFLNLPVFGQTPVYISSRGRWDLWPELPSCLDPSAPALLAWLEKHRLPHFCKSSLCLHLILCQKLLEFVRSGEAAKLLNWQNADQWLLEKCISGSQGMWRFRAFIQGMPGEELTDFWLTTERLLGLNESDAKQRDTYLSLVHRLKATHLREGSSVVTLCGATSGPGPKSRCIQPISTTREMLSKMQEQALFAIQSYWLPKFFIHCKMGMAEEKSCQPLLQEYGERLSQADAQEPSDFSEHLYTMRIKRSRGSSGPYCSKKSKVKIWTTVKVGRNTQEMKTPGFPAQPGRQLGPVGGREEPCVDKDAWGPVPQQAEHLATPACGGKGRTTSPQRSNVGQCEDEALSDLHLSAPSAQQPAETLSFLPWALSAEGCAGRPFRHFLERQDRPVETQLLDLWQDLEEFLPVVLDPGRENSFFLRHLIGEKISKSYLEEETIRQLPLEAETLRSLRNHLMAAEFSPWIYRAQKEICKVLCCSYEEFLADDDRTFLQFMAPQDDIQMPKVQGHAVEEDKCFTLSQRINESLKLSQALHGTRNLESLSSEHWQLIAMPDLWEESSIPSTPKEQSIQAPSKEGSIQAPSKEGSIQAPSEEDSILAEVEPLPCSSDADSQKLVQRDELAEDSPSKKKEPPCPRSPEDDTKAKNRKKKTVVMIGSPASPADSTTVVVEKPSRRPRHFVKVLHSSAHLKFFKWFLEEHDAEEPLSFWLDVEKLVAETSPKMKNFLIDRIVRKYFHAQIPAEEQLGCHSSIISEIREAKVVSPLMLMTAQVLVQKAMEKRWFKEYQDLFPPEDTSRADRGLRHRMGQFMTGKRQWAWYAIQAIIRSISKFQREMNNQKRRVEFEHFLRRELRNKEENLPSSTSRIHGSSATSSLEKEGRTVKRLLFNNQLITVNFLVNDLRFYLEIDKFSRLADGVEALTNLNKASKKEVAFLKRKAAVISKLFLNSDIPPKLRVNISEEDRDLIWSLSSKGLLNRALYHRAKVIIFTILLHFWRRFCTWKVMSTFPVFMKDRAAAASSHSRKPSKSCELYSPSSNTIIVFTLLKGVQILLPHPQKKTEPQEEQKGSEKTPDTGLPLSKVSSQPVEQAPREDQTSKEGQSS
ncbi:regulator of G-protein signaling protein-like isoform X2 [Heliangelus exortis]|uniref:regulator of G-protein signaling protein-like isoform X2 n=1 Tax=Heliangelus exortis TaxID=472823 RepID=UPI003A95AB97